MLNYTTIHRNVIFQIEIGFIKCIFRYFFSVSVQPVSLVVDVKLISMNVHHSHASMVVSVPICHKDTDANVHQAIQEKIVKMKTAIVKRIHVQRVQCAKMNQDMAITHVFAAAATPAQTAI